MLVLVVDGGSTVPTALVCSLGVISVLVALGVLTAVDVVLSGGLVMVVGVVTAVGVETAVGVTTEVVGSCKQLFSTAQLGVLGGGSSVDGVSGILLLHLNPPAFCASEAFLSSFFMNLFNSKITS